MNDSLDWQYMAAAIYCGACEPECPVTAIFPEEDVPADQRRFIALNKDVFEGPNPPGRPNR